MPYEGFIPCRRTKSCWIFFVLATLVVPAWAGIPAAHDDHVLSIGQQQAIDVLANDTEPDGLALDITITNQGSCGSTVQVVDGLILHTPTPGDRSACSMTYQVNADGGGTDTATVTFADTSVIFADGFDSGTASAWEVIQ